MRLYDKGAGNQARLRLMFISQEGCPVRMMIFALKTHQPAFRGSIGCAEWVYAPLHPVWNPNSASLPAFPNVSATQGQSFLEEIIPSPPPAAQDIPLDYY